MFAVMIVQTDWPGLITSETSKFTNDQWAPKLRVLTTGATATKFQPASLLAVFTLHDCMALSLSTAVNKNLFCHDENIGQKTMDNGT